MPNLSDKEKEELINLIKEGKTLPKEFIYKLFADDEDVFLFWNGRSEEVTNVVLPFHSIEHVDEPRKYSGEAIDLFFTDNRGRQEKGWTNKLIWGDNKLVLSSLVNGPLREEIEKKGGLKLICNDSPFTVGADFSFQIKINGDEATQRYSIIEEIAYRDTWGKGDDQKRSGRAITSLKTNGSPSGQRRTLILNLNPHGMNMKIPLNPPLLKGEKRITPL